MIDFDFTATVILWEGDKAAWHFIPLPQDLSEDIDHMFGSQKVGWGSIRVEVTLGGSTWRTSIFPDSKTQTYVLPVKKAVRTAEGIAAGDEVELALTVGLDE